MKKIYLLIYLLTFKKCQSTSPDLKMMETTPTRFLLPEIHYQINFCLSMCNFSEHISMIRTIHFTNFLIEIIIIVFISCCHQVRAWRHSVRRGAQWKPQKLEFLWQTCTAFQLAVIKNQCSPGSNFCFILVCSFNCILLGLS